MDLSTTTETTEETNDSATSTNKQEMQEETNTKIEDKTTTHSAVTEVSMKHRAEGMLETATLTSETTNDDETKQHENKVLNTTNEFTHATTDSKVTTTMPIKEATVLPSEQEQLRTRNLGTESSNQQTTVWKLSASATEASRQTEIAHDTTAKNRVQSEGLVATTDAAMTSGYTEFDKSRDVLWSTPRPMDDKPTKPKVDFDLQYTTVHKMELSTVESQLDSTQVKYATKEESDTGNYKEITTHADDVATVSRKTKVETETIIPHTDGEFLETTHANLESSSTTTALDKKVEFQPGSTVSNDFETESQHHMITKMDDDNILETQPWSTSEGYHQITTNRGGDIIADDDSMAPKNLQHTLTTEYSIDDDSGDVQYSLTTDGDIDVESGEVLIPSTHAQNYVTSNNGIDIGTREVSMSTKDLEHLMKTNNNIAVGFRKSTVSTRYVQHAVTTDSNIGVSSEEKIISTREIENPMTTSSNTDTGSKDHPVPTRDLEHPPMTTNNNIDFISGEEFMSTRKIEHPMTTSSNRDTGSKDHPVPTTDLELPPMTTSSNMDVSFGQNHMSTRQMPHHIL